jgi:RHS repeat-associated protein
MTDAVKNTSTYEYDRLNRRTTMTDSAGGVTTYKYDGYGNVIEQKDALGRVTKTVYDNLNRSTQVNKPLGITETTEYDAVNQRFTTDGEGRRTEYQYDALNRNVLIIDPLGHRTQNIYDGAGNIRRVIDAKGRITAYSYDELNRKIAATQAFCTVDATTMSYIYDAASNLRYETNGRGFTTEYKYDEFNRQNLVIDARGKKTRTEYDVAGKATKTIDAYNNVNTSVYDTFGRLIKSIDAIGDVVAETEYDAIDRAIKSTDTFGKIISIDYDDQLRKKTTVDQHGVVTVEIKDAVGNIKDVYQANRHTHYDFDDLNRKAQVIDAEGGVTKYEYFKDNQTKSMTDAAGNVTSYGYDGGGRMTTETNFFGTRRYGYDDVNNRTDMLDRNGRVIRYAIDNLNRVVAEDWLSLLPVAVLKKFTYGYDANGNVTFADDGNIRYEYSYEERDLVERVDQFRSGQVPVSFVYKYDDVENLIETNELVNGSLQAITKYKYEDPRYYNTQVTQFGVGLANKRVDFVYAADSGLMREVDRYLDNQLIVKTTNAYDDFGRLTGITHTNGAGVISTHGYDYDALNRLTAESRDGVSRQFGYDNIDQVKSVSGSNSESYDYDKNGNRTNAGYEHVAQNRLTSDGIYSYDYDDEGNRTKRTEIATGKVDEYTWDYRNRLVSVVSKDKFGAVLQAVAYEYDVNDLRVKKTVNGVVENYYLDGDNIAFVTDGAGSQTFHYMYGLEADQVLAQDLPTGMVWSLADRLGSINVLVNEQGVIVDQRTYDSFGNTLSQLNPAVKFRFGYTGRESDPETGLYYYRARYFDPNVGRFISTDPIGFEAGDANVYRYVFNNSTTHTDPSGEIVPWLALALGGALVAGAFNAVHQGIKIAEGSQKDGFKWDQFGLSIGLGFVLTPLAVASPILSVGIGAYGTFTGMNHGMEEIKKGNVFSGAFEVITSMIPFVGKAGAKGSGYTPLMTSKAKNGWWNSDALFGAKPPTVINSSAVEHANIGIFPQPNSAKDIRNNVLYKTMQAGGHGQDNMNFLEFHGFEYNIKHTYSNGVRTGNIPSHKNALKNGRKGDKQSWFPKDWNEADIKLAGEFVVNNTKNYDSIPDGKAFYGNYKGVRVGVLKTNGTPSTIFPDGSQQIGLNGSVEVHPHY